jgi:hypothetical protein
LLTVELKKACSRHPVGQHDALLLCARPLQAIQQLGYAEPVVEGDVRGGMTEQQRGGLLLRARLPQLVQQLGYVARLVEGDVRGGAVGQRGAPDIFATAVIPPSPAASATAASASRRDRSSSAGSSSSSCGPITFTSSAFTPVPASWHATRRKLS